MIRQAKRKIILLCSCLFLHSLSAFAQGSSEADGSDLGADPGLPAEAPASTAPASRSPRSSGQTLPAPLPEPLVQPYADAPATPPSGSQAIPGKTRPVLNGKLGELNLSLEQTQQIIELRKQWKPDTERRLKDEFTAMKQSLAQAMADNSTGEEVRRRFDLMQKKYLELQTVKFEKLLRIREVLTPDQRRKFAELRTRGSATGKGSAGGEND